MSSLWQREPFFFVLPTSVLLTPWVLVLLTASTLQTLHRHRPQKHLRMLCVSKQPMLSLLYHTVCCLWIILQLTGCLHPFFSGSEEALSTLLRANTHHAIFYAISHFTKADPPLLRAAFSRALRALAASIADIVGPSLWGLKQDNSIVRNDAQQALQYFFQVRPSILRLFSSLITFMRCYRLKPSISTFHSSSYQPLQPLQPLKPLFRLLFLQ